MYFQDYVYIIFVYRVDMSTCSSQLNHLSLESTICIKASVVFLALYVSVIINTTTKSFLSNANL